MSISVDVYAEARVGGMWISIDHYLHYTRDGDEKFVKVPILEGQSSCYSVLRDYGEMAQYPELSQYGERVYVMPGSWFAQKNLELPEYSGYVPRQNVLDYESGSRDDMPYWEWIGVEEYRELTTEVQQGYQYYEWTEPWGARDTLRRIKRGLEFRMGAFNNHAIHWDSELKKFTPDDIGWEDVRAVVKVL